MIDLTPLEVRQKKGDFRRSVRGYDAELVNDFLDLVADRMEELVKENMALKEQAATLETEVTELRQKERAVSDALMTARKLQEDAKAHAAREGELLVREARVAAEAAREEVARERAREESLLREVRARRAQLVESFRRLLERELAELGVIEESLELDTATKPSGGAARSAARPATRRGGSEPRTAPAADAGKPAAPAAAESSPPSAGGSAPESGAGESPAPDSGESDDPQKDWLSSLVEE